jgi:hypothetical protein
MISGCTGSYKTRKLSNLFYQGAFHHGAKKVTPMPATLSPVTQNQLAKCFINVIFIITKHSLFSSITTHIMLSHPC